MKNVLMTLFVFASLAACGERPEKIEIPRTVGVPPAVSTPNPILEFPGLENGDVTQNDKPTQDSPSPQQSDSGKGEPSQNSPIPNSDVDPVQGPGKDSPKPQSPNDEYVDDSKNPPSAKWGINFEDLPGTDEDYNDAVFCATAALEPKNGKLRSLKSQEVSASLSSISFCKHSLQVKVFKTDKSLAWTHTFDAKKGTDVRFVMGIGEELEVNMIPLEGCGEGETRSMNDSRFAKVLKNQCNLTGR